MLRMDMVDWGATVDWSRSRVGGQAWKEIRANLVRLSGTGPGGGYLVPPDIWCNSCPVLFFIAYVHFALSSELCSGCFRLFPEAHAVTRKQLPCCRLPVIHMSFYPLLSSHPLARAVVWQR